MFFQLSEKTDFSQEYRYTNNFFLANKPSETAKFSPEQNLAMAKMFLMLPGVILNAINSKSICFLEHNDDRHILLEKIQPDNQRMKLKTECKYLGILTECHLNFENPEVKQKKDGNTYKNKQKSVPSKNFTGCKSSFSSCTTLAFCLLV